VPLVNVKAPQRKFLVNDPGRSPAFGAVTDSMPLRPVKAFAHLGFAVTYPCRVSDEPATLRNPPRVVVGADARYTYLQKLIGGVAFAFPILVVFVGQWLDDGASWRSSISAYYYARTGNVFVGQPVCTSDLLLLVRIPLEKGLQIGRLLSCVAGLMAIGGGVVPDTERRSICVGPLQRGGLDPLDVRVRTIRRARRAQSVVLHESDQLPAKHTFWENVQVLVWCPAKFRTPLPVRKRPPEFQLPTLRPGHPSIDGG
jgi:hypothetical protein